MPIDESPTVSPRFARARAAQLGAASAAALMRERALTLEREEDPKAMAFFQLVLGHTTWEKYIEMEVSWVMGVPPFYGWFIRENPTKMDDDWGYPYFRTLPNMDNFQSKM